MRIRIRELREQENLTQKELAEKLGCSQRNISHWESGARQADYQTLENLANFFRVSIDELLGHDVDEKAILERQDSLYFYIRRLNCKQIDAIKDLLVAFVK